jgi:hypothetical protein
MLQYRLVYDVLNDGPPWFGVVFALVPLLLAVVCFLEILRRVRGRQLSPMPSPGRVSLTATPSAIVIVLFLLMGGITVVLAWQTYEGFMLRKQCREWVRAGQHQVTEGTITDYQERKAGPAFRVAGVSFDLLNRSAGFTGRFNVPDAAERSLRDGLHVRLAHEDGFVLRVELAAEQ